MSCGSVEPNGFSDSHPTSAQGGTGSRKATQIIVRMASGLQQCGGRSGYRTPDLFGVNADQIKSNRPGMALVPVKYFGPNDAFDLAMTDLPEWDADQNERTSRDRQRRSNGRIVALEGV